MSIYLLIVEIFTGLFRVGTDLHASNPNEFSRNTMKEVFSLRRQVSLTESLSKVRQCQGR